MRFMGGEVRSNLSRRDTQGSRQWFHLASTLVAALLACNVPGSGAELGGTQTARTSAPLTFAPELNALGSWTFDSQSAPGEESTGRSPAAQITNATWDAAGRAGGALYFNGVDAIATIADGTWNTGSPVTYNLWYRTFGQPRGYAVDHEFDTRANGAFAVDIGAGSFISYDARRKSRGSGFGNEAWESWTMVTIVLDGTTLRTHTNGVLSATASRTLAKLGGPLDLGASSLGKNSFKGWLDEVAVFGRALTEAEIAELYATYTQPPPPPPDAGSGDAGASTDAAEADAGDAATPPPDGDPGQPNLTFGTKVFAEVFLDGDLKGSAFSTGLAPREANRAHLFLLPSFNGERGLVTDAYVSLVVASEPWKPGQYRSAQAGRVEFLLTEGRRYASRADALDMLLDVTAVGEGENEFYLKGTLHMTIPAERAGDPPLVVNAQLH